MIDPENLAEKIDSTDYGSVATKEDYFDGNGHLGTGYYTVLFNLAAILTFKNLEMGWHKIKESGITQFSLSSKLTHHKEVLRGMPLTFSFQLLDLNEKFVHFFMVMKHAEQGWNAATFESLNICIDFGTRRSTQWPSNMMASLSALYDVHRHRPKPADAGQPIAIRRKAVKL